MIGITIGSVLVLLVVVVALFLNLSPQFGGKATTEQKAIYAQATNYKDGKFVNETPSIIDFDFWKMLRNWFKKEPGREPGKDVDVMSIDSLSLEARNPEVTQLFWFGQSTFLLQMDGKNILLDPMFGRTPSPISWLGKSRYSSELPISAEQFPFIDAVILSHDHYDHLDYGTISKLKDKVGMFYVPLGVGNHLRTWKVAEQKVCELNWSDTTSLEEIQLVCTPARHFSGRSFLDRETTLWCSWVIKGTKHSIYFSGDSGYGPHLKTIGDKYGPFDVALLECGQYNEMWHAIHMMPEETAQAALDVQAKLMMPIHWGAFTLAMHHWQDPITRVTKKAMELGIPITTPRIGEPLIIGEDNYPKSEWWINY